LIYTLPHTVINSAARLPNKIAFTDGQKSLTFQELKNRMDQVANLLQKLDVKKGDRVGVYLNRGLETAIAIYGVMRAGGIYVPLDSKSPAKLTRFLIKDCGIKVLITNPSQTRNVRTVLSEQHDLETIIGLKEGTSIPNISWKKVEAESVEFKAEFQILEEDPAYIIYTSGSTGNPKGIVHSHYSGLSYARLTADLYGINENDIVGNHAPVFFDISLLGYFTAPLVGASTLIIPDAYTVLPASLGQIIEKEKLTIWYSVPLALIQLVQKGMLEDRDMSSLRWVLYAGEPFPPKYLRRLMLQWPHANYSNIYGPAETNQCTYYNIPNPPDSEDPIPIGRVWGNTEMFIVDENDEAISPGEVGELLIRSATMMKGYWQQPELTKKSLFKRINSQGFEDTFYRTGDLVREDEGGLLHFLGRKDHQIKTRGYRVELGAVEAVLVAHAEVSEAAIFSIKKEDDTVAIGAAVIVNEVSDIDEKQLIDFLKQQLPFYAIPEQISILNEFPRTGSGKINRSAIKAEIINN